MAKILQIIDVDSDGHKVRLDDGRVVYMPHGGEHPHIGQEVEYAYSPDAGRTWHGSYRRPEDLKSPTIEQLNSDAQAQAQTLSEAINAVDGGQRTESRQEGEHTEKAADLGRRRK